MTATQVARQEIEDRLRSTVEKVTAAVSLPTPEECKGIRVAGGLSRADIARVVPCSEQAVLYWETGKRKPRGQMLVGYVEVLRAIQDATLGASLRRPEAS